MIKSFKHKGLEDFYSTGTTKGIQAIHAKRQRQKQIKLKNIKSKDNMK